MGRVLIAEDETGLRRFLADALLDDGHDVVAVGDGEAALVALREGGFDVLLTDLRMPRLDGMTVVRAARTEQPDVEVIVLTAFGEVATAVEALKLGAFDYREKPLSSPSELRSLVRSALERRVLFARAAASVGAMQAGTPLSWGAPAMRSVVAAIEKVARSSATVLLRGESGTGKEVLARAVHARSPRAGRPFMAINCAVLVENLIDSELFGHEKGAFTGAHTQRRGRLELADGGTFLLDEVAELLPSLQAKLLRVIEERTFERVGGSKAIHVDVRWIAATHRPLEEMVRAGTFRDDLYHRLAVFPVHVPALRERREDIVPLAETLLAQLAGAAGRKEIPALSDEAKTRLTAGAWAGNVRELRNALERAMILQDGPVLDAELFGASPGREDQPGDDASLEGLERRAIETALAAVGGNRRVAAARLGISVRTLYDKLKRYDLR